MRTFGNINSSNNGLPIAVKSAGIVNLACSNTWAPFPDLPCTCIDVGNYNGTGVLLQYRRNGGGGVFFLPDQDTRMIIGITNANQIEFIRQDAGVGVITLCAEYFRPL
jgi:hypothetical protein